MKLNNFIGAFASSCAGALFVVMVINIAENEAFAAAVDAFLVCMNLVTTYINLRD